MMPLSSGIRLYVTQAYECTFDDDGTHNVRWTFLFFCLWVSFSFLVLLIFQMSMEKGRTQWGGFLGAGLATLGYLRASAGHCVQILSPV